MMMLMKKKKNSSSNFKKDSFFFVFHSTMLIINEEFALKLLWVGNAIYTLIYTTTNFYLIQFFVVVLNVDVVEKKKEFTEIGLIFHTHNIYVKILITFINIFCIIFLFLLSSFCYYYSNKIILFLIKIQICTFFCCFFDNGWCTFHNFVCIFCTNWFF